MSNSEITPLSFVTDFKSSSAVERITGIVASIKSIYKNKDIVTRNRGIRWLSLTLLYALYILYLTAIVVVATSLPKVSGLIEIGVIALSVLPPSAYERKRWFNIARVSDKNQKNNTSRGTQLGDLRLAATQALGKIVGELSVVESGSDMTRKSMTDILEKARNGEFDILGVWSLDRFSRANPWDCTNFLYQLRDCGITLYVFNYGFVDWDDGHDIGVLIHEAIFAYEWGARIKGNGNEGQVAKLKQGKYPFGKPPYGYAKGKDDTLYLTELGERVIPEIFRTCIKEGGNVSKTTRECNTKCGLENTEYELTDSIVKTTLEKRWCVGHFRVDDVFVTKKKETQCISDELYKQAQKILSKRKRTSNNQSTDIPMSVSKAFQRYGADYTSSILSMFSHRCPECDHKLKKTNATKMVRSNIYRVYDCDNCDFRDPVVTREQMDRLDSTVPLGCPYCLCVEDFKVNKNQSGELEYIYTCNLCKNRFAVDASPNLYQRAIDHPEVAFRWEDDEPPLSQNTELTDIEINLEDEFVWVNFDSEGDGDITH